MIFADNSKSLSPWQRELVVAYLSYALDDVRAHSTVGSHFLQMTIDAIAEEDSARPTPEKDVDDSFSANDRYVDPRHRELTVAYLSYAAEDVRALSDLGSQFLDQTISELRESEKESSPPAPVGIVDDLAERSVAKPAYENMLRAKSGRYIITSPAESANSITAWSEAFNKK